MDGSALMTEDHIYNHRIEITYEIRRRYRSGEPVIVRNGCEIELTAVPVMERSKLIDALMAEIKELLSDWRE